MRGFHKAEVLILISLKSFTVYFICFLSHFFPKKQMKYTVKKFDSSRQVQAFNSASLKKERA